MRTNIEIDDKLMKQAMKASGLKTKKAVVEEALKLFARIQRQRELLKFQGAIQFWDGYDPKAMTKDKWAEADRRMAEDEERGTVVGRSRKTAA